MIKIIFPSVIYILYYFKSFLLGISENRFHSWIPIILLALSIIVIIYLLKVIKYKIASKISLIIILLFFANIFLSEDFKLTVFLSNWINIIYSSISAIFICLTIYIIGRTLLDLCRFSLKNYYDIYLSYGLGTGITFLFTFLLGLAGLIYKIFIIIPAILFLIYSFKKQTLKKYVVELSDEFKLFFFSNQTSSLNKIFHSLFLAAILFSFMRLVTPPTNSDDLWIYLPIPLTYLNNHKIFYIPNILFDGYPYLLYMMNILGFLFGTSVTCKIISFSFFGAMLGLLSRFVSDNISKKYLYISAALYSGFYLVISVSRRPSFDNGYVFYVFSAFVLLCLFLKNTNIRILILSAIIFGFAFTSKYLAIYSITAFVLSLFFVLRFILKSHYKKILTYISIWVVIALSIGASYWIKNFIFTKNPMYPLYSYIFGGKEDNNLYGRKSIFESDFTRYGFENNTLNKIIAPLNITFHDLTLRYVTNYIGPIFLAFLPFFFFKIRGSPLNKILFIWFIILYLGWITSTHIIRYFLHAFPIMIIMVIVALDYLESFKKKYLLLLLITGLIFPGLTYNLGNSMFAYRYLTGQETSDQYLEKMLGGIYKMHQYINKNIDIDEPIFSINDSRRFYCNNTIIDNCCNLGREILESTSPEQAINVLKKNNIRYVLYSDNNLMSYSKNNKFVLNIHKYLKLIYSSNGIYLYSVP